MTTLVLQGQALTSDIAAKIAAQVTGKLNYNSVYTTIICNSLSNTDLDALKSVYDLDINLLPDDFEPATVKLLVTDMDSTLINIECIDEIADFINVKPQVAAITESAMRGEIDFETSLRQRVSLLKGLDVSALERVYNERLQLNSGAELMMEALKNKGIKTALVSGGFTFFTQRLKERLGLDFTMANVLAEKDGKLTGEVVGDICGGQSKADFLLSHCEKLHITPSQVVAMGDGANDLLMMKEAGLSIAFHAKPAVQQQADTAINICGLDAVVGLLQLS
ncbi:phosphoserine phosphatase SerB [Pseudomonadota bacterium]|nr:phosphoserine phosphatase SerB [Pseudomonadota bacterium]